MEPYECPGEHRLEGTPKGKFAYVSLLFPNDKGELTYLPGAILLAWMLRKFGTKFDICLLVTPDVKEEDINILKLVFDKILEINYVDVKKESRFDQDLIRKFPAYRKTYTKVNLFLLTEYKKILYIDIDYIPLRNLDSLFNLRTPAAVYYGRRKTSLPHMIENNWQPRKKGDPYEWQQKFCDCCGHGRKIPASYTKMGCNNMRDKEYVGMSTEFMLLEPSKDSYKRLLKFFYSRKNRKKFRTDTSLFTCYFSGKWTGVDPRFVGLFGYPHPRLLWGISYGHHKPWDVSLETAKEWLDWAHMSLWMFLFLEMMTEVTGPIHDRLSSLSGTFMDILEKYKEKATVKDMFELRKKFFL